MLVCAPARSWGQDASRFLRWSYQDIGAAFTGARPHDALIAGGAVLLVAGGSHVDPNILETVQDQWDGTEPILKFYNKLGETEVVIPVVGLFGVSLLTKSTRFQDAAFTSLQSLVYASVITTTLKVLVGRARPEDDLGARSFDPFSGHHSMPSGHTTTVFAFITPWAFYYPNIATYGLVASMTITGLARIALDKHWATDVLIGGGIGFLTGRFLSRRHQREADEQRVSITPELGFNHLGMRMTVRLD